MAYTMGYFRGTESQVLSFLGTKIKYPAFAIVEDEKETSDSFRLAFVNQNNKLEYVRGLAENETETDIEKQIVNLDELPPISEGKTDMLYIVDENVYLFNGKEYKCINEIDATEFKALVDRVSTLEEDSSNIDSKVTNLETEVDSIGEQITTLEEKVNASYEKVEYKVVQKPDGTLVDYFNKEIRIMIPSDTDFATQKNASSTGTENIFYIETRVYAPENAIGFRTDVNEIAEDEPIEDFNGTYAGTDEFGRNYFVLYLPIAYYDTESATWVYYGANSTTAHYVGWTQITEWYDADGNLFKQDVIRINLSNEECHSEIKPFYVSEYTSEVTSEIDALKETNKVLLEEVERLTEVVNNFDASIGDNFIELE